MTTHDDDHDHRPGRGPDPEAPPTADEAREAEALARALEPGAGAGERAGAPADLLAAAALVREAGAGVPLAAERAAAVAARLAPSLEGRRRSRRSRWRPVAAAASGLVVCSMAALVFLSVRSTFERAPTAAAFALQSRPLPAPPPALLDAQAAAARGGAPALAALDRQMRAYRHQYLDELARRAGGGGAP
jgi:hypothetical protein